jgi:hypothetical protein
MTTELISLDALGPGGAYHARKRLTIFDLAGTPAAELSLVPRLFVTRAMASLHNAPTLPAQERMTALARAGRIFAEDTIDGLSFTDYQYAVSRVCGVPISVVRHATAGIIDAAGNGPAAATCSPCTPRATTPVRTRSGWRPSPSATASPCGHPGGSRSPRTASCAPCGPQASATTTS